ncbi:c-type cytochrome [Aurantiacibacter gilvus]|uniref:Cytochrome c n=1 Tax=Aurantiacibacter gilvus TaxID=3139141 RepID=A0ABU9IGS7_9SPHN
MSNPRHSGLGPESPSTRASGNRSRIKSGMTIVAGLLLAGCAAVATAQQSESAPPAQAGPPPAPPPQTLSTRPDASGGEALYVAKCAMCHGPGGMGTGLLARRMDTPLLEERDNLAAPFVVIAARNGIGNMPAIPRGEVSDEDLQAIAEYLAAGPHGGAE